MFFNFFISVQSSLLLIMLLHDWIDLPPFTDIAALKKAHTLKERILSTLINSTFVIIPLLITLHYKYAIPNFLKWIVLLIYTLLSIGAICAWWIPYFFGSSQAHKEGFIEYKNTHSFLPQRGNNVRPNTLHIILHIHIFICLLCSFCLFIFDPITQ